MGSLGNESEVFRALNNVDVQTLELQLTVGSHLSGKKKKKKSQKARLLIEQVVGSGI